MSALEVDQAQCLVDFYDDDTPWHHRVLLVRGEQQRCIWLTPDGEVQAADLSTHRVIHLCAGVPLSRRAASTRAVYSFDPISPGDLAYYTADARILAKILGFPGASDLGPETAGAQWFICDPASREFGSVVPDAALANDEIFVARGDCALVELDGTWVSAARVVPPATWDSTRRTWAGGKSRDPRLLADTRDLSDTRFLSFREVMDRSQEVVLPGFPMKGPRAAPELLASIRGADQNSFDEHSMVWSRKSGVPEKSAAAREHRVLSIALRMLVSYNQIDPANCGAAEFLTRRLLQAEAATRRNPRQPTSRASTGSSTAPWASLGRRCCLASPSGSGSSSSRARRPS